jgi:flagellar biosynthesis/type III secretory pathway chaperone
MSSFLRKLFEVHQRELDAYREVLRVSVEEKEALRQNHPLSDIIKYLEKKRELIRMIEAFDHSIAREKAEFKRRKPTLSLIETRELHEIMERIKEVIESIMSVERENEQIILENGRFPVECGGV